MTYWPVTKQDARAPVPGFRFGAVIEQHRLSARDGAPSAVVT
jgi:hypothetical protein